MPIRYIVIPAPITLKDPITGKPIQTPDSKDERITFEDYLGRLMHNPLWGESYHNMKAQREVLAAWDKAKPDVDKPDTKAVIALAEEDWQRLKQAVEFPKPPNLNWHPALASQLLPHAAAIMEATIEDPRAKS
jgi:hypothetical protein